MANLSRTFSTRAAAFSYLHLFDGPTPFLRLTGPRSHRAGRGFQLGGWVPFPQASLQFYAWSVGCGGPACFSLIPRDQAYS